MEAGKKYGSAELQVAIILLTYNCKKLTEKLLPKVLEHTQLDSKIQLFVVDNDSTDDTVRFLKENYPQLELIQFDKNYGFAGGMDKATRLIEAKYSVLLSCDVEVTANWLQPIVDLFESDEKIAAVQPKVLSYDKRENFEYAGASGGFMDHLGFPFCRGRVFDQLEEDKGQYNDTIEVFWAGGCCLAVKRDAYIKSGGLDLDFFAHQEEIDLAWRMQLHSYKVMACPQAHIYHMGGGVLSYNNPFKLYLNSRNNLSMMAKNLPMGSFIATLLVRWVLDALAVVHILYMEGPGHSLAIIRGHLSFLAHFGKWMKKRKDIPNKKSWKNLKGVYQTSLIANYFILGNKSFNSLKGKP